MTSGAAISYANNILENFLSSTKLNIPSLTFVVFGPKSLLQKASQLNIRPLRRGNSDRRPWLKAAILPKKWLLNPLNLPIGQVSTFAVVLSTLFSEGSCNPLFLTDRVTSVMPAYTEWPLLLTTLRLLITGVMS